MYASDLIKLGFVVVRNQFGKAPGCNAEAEGLTLEEVANDPPGTEYHVIQGRTDIGLRSPYLAVETDGTAGLRSLESEGITFPPGLWMENPAENSEHGGSIYRLVRVRVPEGREIDFGSNWRPHVDIPWQFKAIDGKRVWHDGPIPDASPELTELLLIPDIDNPVQAGEPYSGAGFGTKAAIQWVRDGCERISDATHPLWRDGEGIGWNKAFYGTVKGAAGLYAGGFLDSEWAIEQIKAVTEDWDEAEAVFAHAWKKGLAKPMSVELPTFDFLLEREEVPTEVEWVQMTPEEPYVPTGADIREEWLASHFSTVDDILSLPPIEWLIEGLLQVGATAQIVGPSTGGKSLWTFQQVVDLALDGIKIVYCALEGKNGFNARLRAQIVERKLNPEQIDTLRKNLFFYDLKVNLFGKTAKESVQELRAGLQALDARIVVIDTLIRTAPGINENDSGMMQEVIDHADDLRYHPSLAVWLIHHSGHDMRRGRGSSAVPAAIDNTVFIFPVGNKDGKEGRDLVVKVWSDKVKDGAQDMSHVYKRVEHRLGTLKSGKPWTSVVFRPENPEDYKTEQTFENRIRGYIEQGLSWKQARNKLGNDQRKEGREIWVRLLEEGVKPIELDDEE